MKQLTIAGCERPPPSDSKRLDARIAASNQIRRARKERRRYDEVRCPACGEKVVVIQP